MAHLPAPIETPAFAPALATQVRWWAQDGVQQAQLTLTPPEMGPVSVKIVMNDQREARIDFVADMAATRSALEAALPVLAAALDESGLKLSGGGVHDGAAQRQALWQHAQQNGASPSRGAAAPAAGHSVTAGGGAGGTHAQGARGLVDLVA
jgi:flagellar hook-length control protein FliK